MRLSRVFPWAAWAALASTSAEYGLAREAGLGVVCAGAVALAVDAKTLGDMSARYGRQTALWGSVALSTTTATATLLSHDAAVPVVLSALAAAGTHALSKKTKDSE